MAGMRGVNSFLVVRYIIFGLCTICNAVICSVAVWNHSLVRVTQPAQVDIYLIFLGAFSLLSIITLIFVELLCTTTLTTRLWFECAWVALFWIMQLAGGAALIALESETSCLRENTAFLNALCTSEHVLLAFTWMCTTLLLVYLLILVFIAASRYREEPKIWVSDVRVAAIRRCSSSTSNSPLTIRFIKRPSMDIYAPQPARSQPVQAFPSLPHRDLSADYEIEPFQPVFAPLQQMDIPYSSNLPEAIPLPPLAPPLIVPSFSKPIPPLPRDTANVRSLSLTQLDGPRELVTSIEYADSQQFSGPVTRQSSSLPSPSPLGEWPRRDVMQLPAKPRRKAPPSSHVFPNRHMASTDQAPLPADTVTQPRPRRPSGPRVKVPSGGHRPAPLDLSSISNYGLGRRDDAGLNV